MIFKERENSCLKFLRSHNLAEEKKLICEDHGQNMRKIRTDGNPVGRRNREGLL
jgi:hypothetical protein